MDPRLQHRRRRVAEDRARTNLTRLVRVLVVVAVLAAGVWFAQSPFLSVRRIEIRGATEVEVEPVLAAHQVVVGRPMLLLDIAGAQADLAADPWAQSAEVARAWPTRVVVTVSERVPAATVELADGWWVAAADGTILEKVDAPAPGLGTAQVPEMDVEEAAGDLVVGGAVSFLAALPPEARGGATVVSTPDGLEAVVSGFTIRLGRPFDMGEKADVALAIISDGVEEGSIITVVAPASPAVLPPGATIPDGTSPSTTEPPPSSQP